MFLIILIKLFIIGVLVGVGVGVGVVCMFYVLIMQGMGVFCMLGELNFCEGDLVFYFFFGLGFFFNVWVLFVVVGLFIQDVDYCIIFNWGVVVLMIKNCNVGEMLYDLKKMVIVCVVIGMIVVMFFNLIVLFVLEVLQVMVVKVLVLVVNLLVNIVMFVIFWLVVIDVGKKLGFWVIVFGGVVQFIMGNVVLGLVLGILIGKGLEESGWNYVIKVMMVVIVLLFVLSGFFCGFDMKMIEFFNMMVLNWFELIYNLFSGK